MLCAHFLKFYKSAKKSCQPPTPGVSGSADVNTVTSQPVSQGTYSHAAPSSSSTASDTVTVTEDSSDARRSLYGRYPASGIQRSQGVPWVPCVRCTHSSQQVLHVIAVAFEGLKEGPHLITVHRSQGNTNNNGPVCIAQSNSNDNNIWHRTRTDHCKQKSNSLARARLPG